MPPEGWTTVSVRSKYLADLKMMWDQDKKRPQNQQFGAWLDQIFFRMVEHYKATKKYGGFFEFQGIREGEAILLYDHVDRQDVTITIEGSRRRLICSVHGRSDCAHVGFCLGIPEVYHILIERGFKDKKQQTAAKFLLSSFI